jgi:hypothetical protein
MKNSAVFSRKSADNSKKSKTYLNRYKAVEKKPPLTTSRKANGGPVVALFLAGGQDNTLPIYKISQGRRSVEEQKPVK